MMNLLKFSRLRDKCPFMAVKRVMLLQVQVLPLPLSANCYQRINLAGRSDWWDNKTKNQPTANAVCMWKREMKLASS